MIVTVSILILATPPLTPGLHRCGVQWSNYSEICTVTAEGDAVSITSSGPSAKMNGKVVPIDDNNFTFEGELQVTAVPVGYSELTICSENAPYKFRHTGKRKFFRHTQTCPDMTTSYFDIFIDTFDPAAIQPTKKLSAMTGMYLYDSRGTACAEVTEKLAKENGDPTCQRWNDSGLGSPYYDCPITGAAGKLYVFQKKKSCTEIAERLNGEP
jgi:hypothetical protein